MTNFSSYVLKVELSMDRKTIGLKDLIQPQGEILGRR